MKKLLKQTNKTENSGGGYENKKEISIVKENKTYSNNAAVINERSVVEQNSQFSYKFKELWADERTLSSKMILSALCAFACIFTFAIFGPFELYIQNMQYLTFHIYDFILPIIGAGLVLFAVIMIVFLILRGKVYNYALSILFSISIAGYLQGFLNIKHGSLDGSTVDWGAYRFSMLGNCFFWVSIILIVFALLYFKQNIWQYCIKIISLVMIVAQTAALASLMLTTDFMSNQDCYISTDNIYEVSEKNNVIVFLLDTFDNIYADDVLSLHPEWQEKLSGFTYYHNFTGSYTGTFPSITYLLTGLKYDYTVPADEYFAQAWKEKNVLSDIHEDGNNVYMYLNTPYVFGNASNVNGFVDNLRSDVMAIDYKLMLEKMFILSTYRYAPEVFKPYYRIYTGDLAAIARPAENNSHNNYTLNDPVFWDNYCAEGLSVNNKTAGSFIFYHLRGVHWPYNMNENADLVSESWSRDARNAQIVGNMNMIFKYIAELKEKGLYDNTTIIITSDHGATEGVQYIDYLTSARVLTLMIKPAFADMEQYLQISNKQICQDNLRASIVSYFGLDSTGYGRTIESIDDHEDITRYVWWQKSEPSTTKRDISMVTYEVKGDANDFTNWQLISDVPIEYPFF